jgi:hypothetical protein
MNVSGVVDERPLTKVVIDTCADSNLEAVKAHKYWRKTVIFMTALADMIETRDSYTGVGASLPIFRVWNASVASCCLGMGIVV